MIFEEMEIKFSTKASCILCENACYPGGQWLCGAFLNSASNCLKVKNGGSSDDVAVVWRDEGCDDMPLNIMTLKELKAQVWYLLFLSLYIMSMIFLIFSFKIIVRMIVSMVCTT